MDVKVSSRQRKSQRVKLSPAESKQPGASRSKKSHKKQKEELHEQLTEALSNILLGEKIPLDVVNAQTGEIIIPANRKITKTLLRKLAQVYDHIDIDPSPDPQQDLRDHRPVRAASSPSSTREHERTLDNVESGDDIDPGIIKQVKVYIA